MTNSCDGQCKSVYDQKNQEDEIDLMDYISIIWKHKFIILLGTCIPLLLTATFLLLRPSIYMTTYTYDVKGVKSDLDEKNNQMLSDMFFYQDNFNKSYNSQGRIKEYLGSWDLDEGSYKIFLNRFYSQQNLNKISSHLQEKGLGKYEAFLKQFPDKIVRFAVLPDYPDLSKIKDVTADKLEQAGNVKAQILIMTISSDSKEDIYNLASVIRDNLENVMPLCLIAEQQRKAIIEFKMQMARIEDDRFSVRQSLKKTGEILSKIENLGDKNVNESQNNLMIPETVIKIEYLPIDYQIQIFKAKIIQLQETIIDSEIRYSYYADLIGTHTMILADLNKKLESYYTVNQFKTALNELAEKSEKQEMKDHLNSYIKEIENRIAVSSPVIEYPGIEVVSKGSKRIIVIVFGIALMLSMFGAFAMESFKNHKKKTF